MKAGFIAVVGRPNVGKSTLINKLVSEKVAIVSDKAGTTRDKNDVIRYGIPAICGSVMNTVGVS